MRSDWTAQSQEKHPASVIAVANREITKVGTRIVVFPSSVSPRQINGSPNRLHLRSGRLRYYRT
jgi:hypothetical protein